MSHFDPKETMSHEDVMESFGITPEDFITDKSNGMKAGNYWQQCFHILRYIRPEIKRFLCDRMDKR